MQKSDVANIVKRVLAQESVHDLDSVRITKTGQKIEVQMSATGLYDKRGSLYAIAIRERNHTQLTVDIEKALKFANLFEESEAMVLSFDLKGNIDLWNRSAQTGYGNTEQEMSTFNFRTLMAPNEAVSFTQWVDKITQKRTTKTFQAERVKRDGTCFTVTVYANLSFSEDSTYRITLFETNESNSNY